MFAGRFKQKYKARSGADQAYRADHAVMTQALRESWGSPAVHVPLPSTTAKLEHESTPDEAAGAPQIAAKQNWGEPAEPPPDHMQLQHRSLL